MEGSVRIPEEKLDLNKANPRVGVGAVGFSSDSRYMFTRNGRFSLLTHNALLHIKNVLSWYLPTCKTEVVMLSCKFFIFCFLVSDNMPTALWIWDVQRLTQAAVLLQESPIKCTQRVSFFDFV